MLNKLALRNAGRLWKDYLLYFLTLCMIVALIFSFHSLLFSKDIYEMIRFGNSGELSTAGTMLIAFLSVSTVVIIAITAWLIHYMTRFILERRSREFVVYLLAGMQKRQIAALFGKENAILGLCALCAGLLFGCGLRQILFYAFYQSIGKHYEFAKQSPQANVAAFLLTIILYGVCFIAALVRSKNKFSRMEIIQLLRMNHQNETVSDKRNILWKRLFFFRWEISCFLIFSFLQAESQNGPRCWK